MDGRAPLNIESLTIGEAREIAALLTARPPAAASHPYIIGKQYFVRTVTMHLTGRLVAVHAAELVLEEAAWVASTGRFADALAAGRLDEVEPFPDGRVIVGRGAIVDVCGWGHPLPREQK